MRVLINGIWQPGYLDQALFDGAVRIQPLVWLNLCKIDDLYICPERSWRLIFNYICSVGFSWAIKKIVSRLNEAARNEKYLSVGIGVIVESRSSILTVADSVIFCAPCHAQCMERVVLHEALTVLCAEPVPDNVLHQLHITQGRLHLNPSLHHYFFHYRGWSEQSGEKLPHDFSKQLHSIARTILEAAQHMTTRFLPFEKAATICERTMPVTAALKKHPKKIKALLLGYGQYAKTIIMPSIKKWAIFTAIHELDPTQLPRSRASSVIYDTAPWINQQDDYQVCFVAGYHHTHAALAIAALSANRAVVIEKPVATTSADLKRLINAMQSSQAPLFVCFQKKYLSFNQYIKQDLNITEQDPLSYHCVVFEIPLPARHWYRWPVSCSRLLSNGCHWVDHFLFLNHFSPVERYDRRLLSNGDLQVWIELKNGAVFTMLLTDRGSNRVGLREYISLRTAHRTVTITDGCQYIAENKQKILRRKQINKLSVYRFMYRTMMQRIVSGLPGDSIESVERSAALLLSLESCHTQNELSVLHEHAIK